MDLVRRLFSVRSFNQRFGVSESVVELNWFNDFPSMIFYYL